MPEKALKIVFHPTSVCVSLLYFAVTLLEAPKSSVPESKHQKEIQSYIQKAQWQINNK